MLGPSGKVRAAVRKGEAMVLEPNMVKLTPLLKGALPTSVTDTLMDLMGASTGMKSWKGGGS